MHSIAYLGLSLKHVAQNNLFILISFYRNIVCQNVSCKKGLIYLIKYHCLQINCNIHRACGGNMQPTSLIWPETTSILIVLDRPKFAPRILLMIQCRLWDSNVEKTWGPLPKKVNWVWKQTKARPLHISTNLWWDRYQYEKKYSKPYINLQTKLVKNISKRILSLLKS